MRSRISNFLRPAQRCVDFELIRIIRLAACHFKTERGILVKFKSQAKLLSSYLPVSLSRVFRASDTSPYHPVPKHLRTTWSRPEQSHLLNGACTQNGTHKRRQRQRQTERPPPEPSDIFKRFRASWDNEIHYFIKQESELLKKLRHWWVKQTIEIFMGSRISKFLRPAPRYGDFKLIRINCQAASHGKTEHGIFVKFENPEKLLSSYLPVSPSRVLRAPGTSPHHLVPNHLRTKWSRLEQSHHLPEACTQRHWSKQILPKIAKKLRR